MFFYIGEECPIDGLIKVEPNLYLDKGWNHKSGIWYKGYSTECVLEDSVYDIGNGFNLSQIQFHPFFKSGFKIGNAHLVERRQTAV